MRKCTVVFIALAMLVAGAAAWADTNTLAVNASVTGTCRFSAANSTLAFGPLDPAVGTDVNGSTTTTFWCTKGVTDTITNDTGLNFDVKNRMRDTVSGEYIPYTLALSKNGTNGGPSAPRTLTIAGNILGSDYTTKSAGSYSDTVVLTITP
ncbi:MAG: spore coat protein U domain-containing protein [Candidatus Deferrimicrobiaceae bacterium]